MDYDLLKKVCDIYGVDIGKPFEQRGEREMMASRSDMGINCTVRLPSYLAIQDFYKHALVIIVSQLLCYR
jgi:hypothetical protein